MKRLVIQLGAMAALLLLCNGSAFSQTSPELQQLRRQIEELKAGQDAMQKDVKAIKEMFEAMRPRTAAGPTLEKPILVSIEGGAIKGEANAKVTLVEFTDYQCPFCARHFKNTLPQLDKEYVKTGKLKYVLREFPIPSLHPQAVKAAEAANCSGDQGKYWEMHSRLFANQKAFAPEQLLTHAKAVGVEAVQFKSCLDSGKYAAKVQKDIADGKQAGTRGTPTFFLGMTEPQKSEIKAIKRIVGAQSFDNFKQAIDELLSQKPSAAEK